MHATHLPNKHLSRMCQAIHKKRLTALMDMVQACIQGKKLSVTGLGRSINNTVFEKHNIKRADRLIGNPTVQARFLKTLGTLLPESCCPIIVSDAGFRNPWFRAVQAMGWDFVGRVGGHTMISPHNKTDWIRVEPVFDTATTRPKYLGHIDLARNTPLGCHAYLVKKKKQDRVNKTVFGERCTSKYSEKNAQRERIPWLIVTSLEGGEKMTKRVMNLYKTRMQIEEGFRDFKNSRWGFSLDEARVSATYRYENLLLIGALAIFTVWLIGKLAEMKNQHRHYQANTVKSRNVLSIFYLGSRVLQKEGLEFRERDFKQAIQAVREQFGRQCHA